MFKKVLGFFSVTLLIVTSFGYPNTTKAKETFIDLGSHAWAEDAIYYLNERGVINGYGDGIFGPSDNITREQASLNAS